MTYRRKSAPGPSIRPIAGALLVGAAVTAGCTSTSQIDTAFSDLTPQQRTSPLPPPTSPDTGTDRAGIQQPDTSATGTDSLSGAVTTTRPGLRPAPDGAFVPIGAEPPPSTNQMTDAERDALLAEMEALQATSASGTITSPNAQARINQIQNDVATYEAEVLRRIETGEP